MLVCSCTWFIVSKNVCKIETTTKQKVSKFIIEKKNWNWSIQCRFKEIWQMFGKIQTVFRLHKSAQQRKKTLFFSSNCFLSISWKNHIIQDKKKEIAAISTCDSIGCSKFVYSHLCKQIEFFSIFIAPFFEIEESERERKGENEKIHFHYQILPKWVIIVQI